MLRWLVIVISIGAVLWGAYWYLSGGRISKAVIRNEAYCNEYDAKIKSDDYVMSYGERARAVSEGCM